MKRIGLMLLACLLLALPTVAQAPEKAAPNDLVVTAEIVGHRYSTIYTLNGRPQLILATCLTLRNQSTHPRTVTMMTCDWDASWEIEGPYRFESHGCDHNSPESITIPVGQALVFYGELEHYRNQPGQQDSVAHFKALFYDITDRNLNAFFSNKRISCKQPTKYWSNELTDNIRPTATPAVAEAILNREYQLVDKTK